MMTEITAEQRTAFVEYLAHLNAGQYDRTLTDLVNLGFIPAELDADPVKRALVAPVIAQVRHPVRVRSPPTVYTNR
jgi:aarF domain-containing kinase